MSHREDLLEGAKRCLYEKGYARTTARDIVAASGANLASIGYHFGSKEDLLNAALIDALADMGQHFVRINAERPVRTVDELADAWTRSLEAFDTYRPLLVAQVEAWAQLERSPTLRSVLADHARRDRAEGAAAARSIADMDEPTATAVAAVIHALADGMVVQWLLDPENAPSGAQIAAGLRALGQVSDGETSVAGGFAEDLPGDERAARDGSRHRDDREQRNETE